jgi:hypothetical protein
MEDFFKKHPEVKAHFEYGRPEKGHGWFPWSIAEFVKMMSDHIEAHAPAGTDFKAWHC